MILKAIIDDQVYTLNVPERIIEQGASFFDQLDQDMDRGWQMSREWVDHPSRLQRCQIVADKLLTAMEKENERIGRLMAGYLLARLPNLDAVELDLHGEIQNNQFHFRDAPTAAAAEPTTTASSDSESSAQSATQSAAGNAPGGLNKMQAIAQAGQDVTKVFKVGKAWRFSVFDHDLGQWQDSPLIATEQEAERLRQTAFKARYEALVGAHQSSIRGG
ncbi:MAG TPA: hypothetical protein DDY14_04550 [Chromatiaceae bacterium]|jgi:hypothetical protein|nr:MAG: hypothetical protein N838_13285 [Thiohalocapsa sp. PB-PSB1]QQO54961.1 MAG: hypothetical protein N838_18015 [Thiohalocapsa sp. PB-PSB1]HBG94595.1 hypothetical protein [Chromatiaceae bacterium]